MHDGREHNTLQSEAGYIDARPYIRQIDETLLQRTAGPYIRVISAEFPMSGDGPVTLHQGQASAAVQTREIEATSPEAMSHELNQPERREFRLELAESKPIVRSPAAGR